MNSLPTQAPSTLYPATPKGATFSAGLCAPSTGGRPQVEGHMVGFHDPCLEVARSLPPTFYSSELVSSSHVPREKGEGGLANNKPVSAIEMIYFLVC